ncbi:hypothetical protein [Kitasatospora sp. RG8]|uniref:tetratricopeptide repeat protein n=1 Tax=Kitasatospora sp. RG8 TaxID=2820815 RepID=UPI001FD75270|nr:hypothetical protein [Kitasatospora sp. RG8]
MALSGYVTRDHDHVLAGTVRQAAQGASGMLVLVGSSSTGKTRACWEAVQPLAARGWALWHPFDPSRAEAALADLERVTPRTVVWLNEAQHYLGHPEAGERIAAALHTLLTHSARRPVLILGTLWPEYASRYTALPNPGAPDPHTRVRELLAARTVSVPESFDRNALHAATALARGGDHLLADALTRARAHGRITQDLAGAPELLRRYDHGTPAVRALLEAAMDARRLGVGLQLPQAFLTDAAADYITDHAWDQLTEDWAEAAFADLARPVHGKQAPLRRTADRPPLRPPGGPVTVAAFGSAAGPMFRLADYLEQHGRSTRTWRCPPASFWNAAHTHLTRPDDLNRLAESAEIRHRLQWAHYLRRRAADAGHFGALTKLVWMRENTGDWAGAETLYQQAAEAGHTDALMDLAQRRENSGDREGAEALYRQARDAGSTNALTGLARMRERAGDRDGAEAFARQAADAGNTDALTSLAQRRESTGDREGAESLYRQAAQAGDTNALADLARMRERAGDRDGAEAFMRQAAATGDTYALIVLTRMRERAGDLEGAEDLYRQAADVGYIDALVDLAQRRERAGNVEGAEDLYRQAADAGSTNALTGLAWMRERDGDRKGAEALALQAAGAGNTDTLTSLAQRRENTGDREGAEGLYRQAAGAGSADALAYLTRMREQTGDHEGAEAFARQAAEAGSTIALSSLARMREETGDREGAEALAWEAAEAGHTDALVDLARMRDRAGDRESAEILYRQVADAGRLYLYLVNRERWPYGLDPDGSPTPPWP